MALASNAVGGHGYQTSFHHRASQASAMPIELPAHSSFSRIAGTSQVFPTSTCAMRSTRYCTSA